MSQELGQQDGAVSSKTGCKGEEPVGWEQEGGALTRVKGRSVAGGKSRLGSGGPGGPLHPDSN